MTRRLAACVACLLACVTRVDAHGRLSLPAARNAAWRDAPSSIRSKFVPNYNLDGLAAGGPGTVPKIGHGLCGDQADAPQDHMEGGKWGQMLNGGPPEVTASYRPGEPFEIGIVLTAHHDGFFEFRLCVHPDDKPWDETTQGCLDQHVLQLANPQEGMSKSKWLYNNVHPQLWTEPGSKSTSKWEVPPADSYEFVNGGHAYAMKYIMPNVECKRCTLQWYYQTGNSPIAYPEEFWNCADIQVTTGALAVTPPKFEKSPYVEQQLFDQTLGGCGVSGTANGQKCFSIDVRVTDQWCDKVKCAGGFTWDGNGRPGDGHMCMWVNVNADCAPITIPPEVQNRVNLANQPTPAPWTGEQNMGGTTTNTNDNYNTNIGGTTNSQSSGGGGSSQGGSGGGGGGGSSGTSNNFDFNFQYNSNSNSNFNYNWNTQYTGNTPVGQVSSGGKGGCGKRTISTSTSTSTSTFH